MTTTDLLRNALALLADDAPDPSTLDHSQWADSPRPLERRYRPVPLSRIVAVTSAAAVIAIVALIGSLTSPDRSMSRSGSASPLSRAAQLFGPHSMPGMELDSVTIGRQRQTYVYDTPGAPFDQLAFELDVVVANSSLNAIMSRTTRVAVAATYGWFSTAPLTASNSVYSWLYAPAPAAKFSGRQVPAVSSVAWPVDRTHWAILFPIYVNGISQVLSRADLVARASSITRDDTTQLAGVRVGYIPAGLALTAVFNQPPSRSATEGGATRPGPAALSGSADRILTFTRQPVTDHPLTATSLLSIQVIDGASVSGRTASQLPSILGSHWTKSSIHGHLAWISPRAILIQWGGVVVGVTTAGPIGSNALLASSELLKVANSLRAPRSYVQQPYNLPDALPASALK